MKVQTFNIKGLVEIIPSVFEDSRGYFFESYNKEKLLAAGIEDSFVQDNQSFSLANVVRGLHFQKEPYGQGKLVRVIQGRILDIAVDLRKSSPTFGQYEAVVLDGSRNNMLYIPVGFAHGFAALEESIVMYKCTNLYHKISESGIRWDDPDLNIDWRVSTPIVSDKDLALKSFKELTHAEEVFN